MYQRFLDMQRVDKIKWATCMILMQSNTLPMQETLNVESVFKKKKKKKSNYYFRTQFVMSKNIL